jgi:hypothetical protein
MLSVGENWTCPYCGHAQVLAEARVHVCTENLNADVMMMKPAEECM